MNKELLQQALDALIDSVDLVAGAYAEAVELYSGYPSRASRIARLKRELDAHEAAIFALITAIAQPTTPEDWSARLADLHQYEEIAEHYAKCEISPEALRNWVADRAAIAQPVQPAEHQAITKSAYLKIAEDYRKVRDDMFSGSDVAEWCELEAIAHPVQPAATYAPVLSWDKRVQAAHPKSEPEFWPDELRLKYMAVEISELRAAIAQQVQPVPPSKTFAQERAQLDQEWCELQHLKAAYKLPQPVQPAQDGYGKTDFGFTFAGVAPSEGEKRLMAMLVEAFGTDHPAIDYLTALIFNATSKPAQPAAVGAVEQDAKRYRWLRQQDWFNSKLCVLRDPQKVLTRGNELGADCPSRERLDQGIDAAIASKEVVK